MITEFRLPEVEPGITTVTVVAWYKNVGERIAGGEILLDVMTEKVNVSIECPTAGRVVERLHDVDAQVTVGDVIARIDSE